MTYAVLCFAVLTAGSVASLTMSEGRKKVVLLLATGHKYCGVLFAPFLRMRSNDTPICSPEQHALQGSSWLLQALACSAACVVREAIRFSFPEDTRVRPGANQLS